MPEVDLSAAVQRIRTRVDYGERKRMLAVAVPLEDLKAVLAWLDEFLSIDLPASPHVQTKELVVEDPAEELPACW